MLDAVQNATNQTVESTAKVSNNYNHQFKAEEVKADKQPKPEQKDVEVAVEELNSALDMLNVQRQFTVEKDLNQVVVKLLDPESKDVIRQFPSEEAISLAKNIKEMVGLLFDSTT